MYTHPVHLPIGNLIQLYSLQKQVCTHVAVTYSKTSFLNSNWNTGHILRTNFVIPPGP